MKRQTFGDLVRDLRLKKRIGLREFSQEFGVDPSNWSKIERGLLAPPADEGELSRLSDVLGLPERGIERQTLNDLAYVERGRVPPDILEDAQLASQLPVFFRTIRGEKPRPEELRKLVEILRRS